MSTGPGILFLISRPVEAYRQAAEQAGLGDCRFEAPLNFQFQSMPAHLLASSNGFVLSSQTGAESLAGYPVGGKPCWAIGSATAKAAELQGLRVQAVVEGGGARFIEALDRQDFQLPDAGLIWPTAQQPAFDLDRALAQRGVDLTRISAYAATAKPSPSTQTAAWLGEHPTAIVALFSQQCMHAFSMWQSTPGLDWKPAKMLAIGPRVFDGVTDFPEVERYWPAVASRQSFTEMLASMSDGGEG